MDTYTYTCSGLQTILNCPGHSDVFKKQMAETKWRVIESKRQHLSWQEGKPTNVTMGYLNKHERKLPILSLLPVFINIYRPNTREHTDTYTQPGPARTHRPVYITWNRMLAGFTRISLLYRTPYKILAPHRQTLANSLIFSLLHLLLPKNYAQLLISFRGNWI